MMSLLRLLILLLVCSDTLFGQENDYYHLPANRKLTEGKITLPNLKTEHIYWYFRPNAGIKLQGNFFDNNLNNRLTKSSSTEMVWSFNLGFNQNDKQEFELGYMQNPQRLEWQVTSADGRLIPYSFAVRRLDHRIQAIYKKRLFILDRVTRKTRLNAVAGLQVSPFRQARTLEEIDFFLPTLPGRTGFNDTLRITADFNQKKNLPTGILGIELTGRVAEPLEIGLFGSFLIDAKGLINSQIDIKSTLTDPIQSGYYLKGIAAVLGVTLRWNFINGIRYTPETP
jgi:hypothetical protein